MIPFIRSHLELMAITESRDSKKHLSQNNEINKKTLDSGQSNIYIRSFEKEKVNLPRLPKIIRRKWMHNNESVSRFLDELDYNNQIQSTLDLTLQERQNNRNKQDIA